jgi:hypothetical protein
VWGDVAAAETALSVAPDAEDLRRLTIPIFLNIVSIEILYMATRAFFAR